MESMYKLFEQGDKIGGYCSGFFGRDDYENKVCVLVQDKYAVFEYENGMAAVLNMQEDLSKKNVDTMKKEHGVYNE